MPFCDHCGKRLDMDIYIRPRSKASFIKAYIKLSERHFFTHGNFYCDLECYENWCREIQR